MDIILDESPNNECKKIDTHRYMNKKLFLL